MDTLLVCVSACSKGLVRSKRYTAMLCTYVGRTSGSAAGVFGISFICTDEL